jgi:hypothetical protein
MELQTGLVSWNYTDTQAYIYINNQYKHIKMYGNKSQPSVLVAWDIRYHMRFIY